MAETLNNHENGNNANTVLAAVGSLVKVGKHTYKITDEPIKDGDMIWNEPSKCLDKCIAVFSDNSIVVQFDTGARAVFQKKRFQKVVRQ
jgi:hypothetical protein